MKRNNRLAVSLLSWTLAAFLLSGQASAAPESGDSSAAAEGSEAAETAETAEAVEDAEAVVKTTEVPETDTTAETSAVDGENPAADGENPEEETAELQGILGWKNSRHLSVTVEDWRLGQAPNPPAVTGSVEDAPPVFIYRDESGVIVPDIDAAPAGTYTLTVFAEETEDYAAASARCTFSIFPAYTVTWVNEDGSLLEEDRFVEPGTVPHYDGEEPAKAATPAYTYTFRGWEPALTEDSAVSDDITYTAIYTETLNQYSVDFLDDDGTALRHAVYGYGTKAEDIVRPADPKKGLTSQYAYTFWGWTPEITDVTGHAAYTAVYDRTPVEIYHYKENPQSTFTTFVEPCAGGTVRVLPTEARSGTPVLLTPVPDSGYVLDVLTVRGLGRAETLGLTRSGDRYTFIMPSYDVYAASVFRKLDTAGEKLDAVGGTGGQEPVPAAPESETAQTVQKSGETGQKMDENSPKTRNTEQDSDHGGGDVVQYSLVKTGSGTASDTGFEDVPGSAYYARAVQWAAGENVLPAVTASSFAPGSPCTRAQMVLALWRASGSPRPSIGYGNPFSDVDVNSPYYEAVLWAMEKGVTRGTTSSTFSPDRPVSRAQAVTLLYRLRGHTADRANPFSDAAQGQYFYEAALWACSVGVTQGTTASTFSPHTPCSRAQAAAFLFRAFQG